MLVFQLKSYLSWRTYYWLSSLSRAQFLSLVPYYILLKSNKWYFGVKEGRQCQVIKVSIRYKNSMTSDISWSTIWETLSYVKSWIYNLNKTPISLFFSDSHFLCSPKSKLCWNRILGENLPCSYLLSSFLWVILYRPERLLKYSTIFLILILILSNNYCKDLSLA